MSIVIKNDDKDREFEIDLFGSEVAWAAAGAVWLIVLLNYALR